MVKLREFKAFTNTSYVLQIGAGCEKKNLAICKFKYGNGVL